MCDMFYTHHNSLLAGTHTLISHCPGFETGFVWILQNSRQIKTSQKYDAATV